MTSKILAKILAVFLIIGVISVSSGQESFETYMELYTLKYADGMRDLKALITADTDEGEIMVFEASVLFYTLSDTGNILLGSAITSKDGKAILKLQPGADFPKDEEGYFFLLSIFAGNEQFGPSEAELAIKDARIEVGFSFEEDIKMIDYAGYIIGPDGEEVPLADDDIYLYVPRMFNSMKIADGWLEEDGKGSNEFPPALIGDSLGNIMVIAKIEEHYDYGDLIASAEIDWAIPKDITEAHDERRELWTPIAPLWMIVTLIIMLTGVWGHYFYAIIQLFMIKKSSKQNR